ncbi:MAG: hypothetical protein U9P07_00420 [Pseudomonadota bacterium]|nr:hypothetical protein [Pseudomonadota bacterium]
MSSQYSLPAYGNYLPGKKTSSMEIIQSISFLTKLGALCLITGKVFMLVAVAGIFVPTLNAYAIPCTIIWGTLVFTSIILCSVDHYIARRRSVAGGEIEKHGYSALDALMYNYSPNPNKEEEQYKVKA